MLTGVAIVHNSLLYSLGSLASHLRVPRSLLTSLRQRGHNEAKIA
jgi:hypothetical protein